MVDLANVNTPEELAEAKEFLNAVNSDLTDIKNKFFHIGYLLTKAYQNRYYKTLGYASITDLAEDKFDGLTKAVTYNLMQIYKLARDFRKPETIAEEYKPYSQSQILAISRVKYASGSLLKIIKPSDSVADIKKFVSLWNKYASKHSTVPKCKSVTELLEQYGETKSVPKTETKLRMDLFQISEKSEFSEEEKEEFSTRVENLVAESNVSEAQFAQMTNEELFEYCLKLERFNFIKFPIYEAFTFEVSMSEFKETVRKAYGNFFIGTICEGYSFSSDANVAGLNSGLIIGRHNGGKNVYSWGAVAGKISRLIQADNYLTAEEKESYLKWKAEHGGITEEAISEEAPEEDFDTYNPGAYVQSHSTNIDEDIGPDFGTVPRARTNREYLAELSDEQFVSELCMKIIRIFPMGGKSSQFMSTVQSKLIEWLSESSEVQE